MTGMRVCGACVSLGLVLGCRPEFRTRPPEMISQLRSAATEQEVLIWLRATAGRFPPEAGEGALHKLSESDLPAWASAARSRYPFAGASIEVTASDTNAIFTWGSGRGVEGYYLSASRRMPDPFRQGNCVAEMAPGIYSFHGNGPQ